MLLITKDFYVYDVPIGSIDTAINKLYLRTKPIPLSEKYPILYQNKNFQYIKNRIFNAFIMTDINSEWICITTWYTRDAIRGINYAIDTSEVYRGWGFEGDIPEVLISTDEICVYYSLRRHEDYSLHLNTYKCEGNDIRNHQYIDPQNNYQFAICHADDTNTNITIEWNYCKSGNPVRWPVLKGFVTDGKFYLFGEYYIYIFDENVFHKQGVPYQVKNRSYNYFFNCAGIIPPGQVISSSCK
ncbi:hypothetical protein BLA29_009562 [Euroglyphus maynei]|uniref:Uncharacterized protein n=1 Tax=Euroglyphus maynei TaxID=6958 RepID=A0A1Y3BBE2_EURMA|nr:hypothetical protein BLA29_009562 [Euroglyphus maynei]